MSMGCRTRQPGKGYNLGLLSGGRVASILVCTQSNPQDEPKLPVLQQRHASAIWCEHFRWDPHLKTPGNPAWNLHWRAQHCKSLALDSQMIEIPLPSGAQLASNVCFRAWSQVHDSQEAHRLSALSSQERLFTSLRKSPCFWSFQMHNWPERAVLLRLQVHDWHNPLFLVIATLWFQVQRFCVHKSESNLIILEKKLSFQENSDIKMLD